MAEVAGDGATTPPGAAVEAPALAEKSRGVAEGVAVDGIVVLVVVVGEVDPFLPSAEPVGELGGGVVFGGAATEVVVGNGDAAMLVAIVVEGSG